ncbi:hypothetical protein GGD55_002560 [Rhizobium giardinii]|uniref:Uncharacterized protein n=1 Tax=Rhizobium giardinii TaxID=56731 RepID=A0A7W8UAK8_9HYPH|nr:hypothetical protein [Rhizobium giardinii]
MNSHSRSVTSLATARPTDIIPPGGFSPSIVISIEANAKETQLAEITYIF